MTDQSTGLHPEDTPSSFLAEITDNLYRARGSSLHSASAFDSHWALAMTVRDRLVDRWRRTTEAQFEANPKFVYYLSAEYLPGRQLAKNLLITGTLELARRALEPTPVSLDGLLELDPEPALGNGGLGRLASCYLDSMATLDIPAVGYGLRYEHGIFRQSFRDGRQIESPDSWLHYGNPWEFPQPDDMVEVGFGGRTVHATDPDGRLTVRWQPEKRVLGEPYHTLVAGWSTATVNLLRLWRARATREFDLELFDVGDYERAVADKVDSETISKVLYPNDATPAGRALRLKQQYFFVACSLHDILRRFRLRNDDWTTLPDKVAIQLNDTHPVVAVPELMRLLVDVNGLDWEPAWEISRRCLAYTCHTLLPEALETWPVVMFGRLLPRHLEIVYEINRRFLGSVRDRFPGDDARVARMSLIEEQPERRVRMANLAVVGGCAVNGVAELHSRLLREHTLHDFAELFPERFTNVTNGVTPRRFVALANPRLAHLISEAIGDGWVRDLDRLAELEPHADDAGFQHAWREVKAANKADLAALLARRDGIEVDPATVHDVLVKRIHEYKRQLLKILEVVAAYHRIVDQAELDVVPRTVLLGGKAAPGYRAAKLIIRLAHAVAGVVNGDPAVAGRLRVVFPANFDVSLGERIYPAADLSEQISLAGKEASGTGNMKFALNGAVTVGTLDGANIEILQRVGDDNFFLFGMTVDDAMRRRERGYDPRAELEADGDLRRAVDAIADGAFSTGDRELFRPLVASLVEHDSYMVLADFRSYLDCVSRALEATRDQDGWTRRSILNTARSGFFSSDRSIRDYCERIWKAAPIAVE